MGIRTRIDSFDRDLDLIVSEDLAPEAQARQFAAAAREARDEAIRQNTAVLGRSPAYSTFVNGREGAAEETVTLPGAIAYEFDLASDLLADIDGLLVRHSPVKSGRYARSFKIFVDGVEKPAGSPLPADAEEIVFVNSQPYARKIERGSSDQAPEGVFQAVAALAAKRFGNVATIKFTYRSLQESGVVAYQGRRRGAIVRGRKGRFAAGTGASTGTAEEIGAQARERETRTPAILVRLR